MKNTKTLATYGFISFVTMFVFYFDSNMLSSSKWDSLFYDLCEYQCLHSIDVAIMCISFLLGVFFIYLTWKTYKWKWGWILSLAFIVAIISYIILSAVIASIIFAL